jgi:hypothetical protein
VNIYHLCCKAYTEILGQGTRNLVLSRVSQHAEYPSCSISITIYSRWYMYFFVVSVRSLRIVWIYRTWQSAYPDRLQVLVHIPNGLLARTHSLDGRIIMLIKGEQLTLYLCAHLCTQLSPYSCKISSCSMSQINLKKCS